MRKMLTAICWALFVLSPLPLTAQGERSQETNVRRCDEADVLGGGDGNCTTESGDATRSGTWNPDGSYTDSDGYTVDGAGRGRSESEESQEYANFQTSNAEFNRIMNRYANNPNRSCVRQAEADLVNRHLAAHPELCDAVTQTPVNSTQTWDGCEVAFTICQL